MNIGLFSVADHYPHELDRSVEQLYSEILEQIICADRLGFESYWLAEHHFHEYGAIPRPALLLAAAAERTSQIGLGAAVVVLPFDNPVRVAEDFAMLDIISGGRVLLGVGSGYLSHEFEGFGIDPAEKRERFDEGLDILLKAWRGKKFSHEGRFWNYTDLQLNVQPRQGSTPHLWIAILSNGAAYHIGRRGLPIMTIPYATTESFDELSEMTEGFRKGWSESGREMEEATVRFGLHVYCAPTTEQAMEEGREWMEQYVRTRLFAKQRTFESLVEQDLIAFGSPEEVARIVARYEEAGITHMMAITNFGGMPHEKAMASIELLRGVV